MSTVPRFETQPYQAEGGCDGRGLAMVFAATLALGVVLGWLASLIGQWIYLIVVFPLFYGMALGFGGALAVNFAKVRHPHLAGLAGAVGGLAVLLTMHYCDYGHWIEANEKEQPGFSRQWNGMNGSFLKYVEVRADMGLSIGKPGRKGGLNLGAIGWYLHLLVEGGILAGMAYFMMMAAAMSPFCGQCQTWKDERALGRLNIPQTDAQEAFQSGELTRLATQNFATPDGPLQVKVAVCPRCGPQAPVDVKLELMTKDDSGKESSSELTHVTYPGHALAVLEALAKPS